MGDDTVNWEGVGRISPQGEPQADGTATLEGGRQEVGVSPSDGRYGGVVVTGGGYLCLLHPEYSRTVHYNQDHYGPVSGGGEVSGVTDVQ